MISAVISTPIMQKRIKELADKRIAVEEKAGAFGDLSAKNGGGDELLYNAKKTQRKVKASLPHGSSGSALPAGRQ